MNRLAPPLPPCRTAGLLALALVPFAVLAGRPLTVDDAGTNAKGEGQLEVWVARADRATTLNLAPAFAFAEGFEASAQLARGAGNDLTASALQLKWLWTPSQDSGCNAGASAGAAHARAQGESAPAGFLTGLFSCNGTPLGNLHLNLGALKTRGESAIGTWGLALEHEFAAVTPHLEYFGAGRSKPVLQIGARADIAEAIQLDGTLGRSDRATLYSVGMKFGF